MSTASRVTSTTLGGVPPAELAPVRGQYRAVLANREFSAILVSQSLSMLGDQVARIAIAILAFERTGSAFVAAATYAVSYLAWLIGGPFSSSLADRFPRRTVMVVSDLGRAALISVLLIDSIPLPVVFGVLVLAGLLAPPFDSARGAMLPDLLPGDQYVHGSLVINLMYQGAQVAGFALGGALVATLGTRTAIAVDVASYLISALALVAFVKARPAAATEPSRGVLRDTRAGLQVVRDNPRMRRLLVYALLAMAIVIAPEGVAVAVADRVGGGDAAAGLLTASVPLGFLIGGFALLRVPAAKRESLLPWLCLLSAVPLLLTPLVTQLGLLIGLWVLSGTGSALQIVAAAAYVQAAPAAYRSRAYGIAVTCLMGIQGLTLLVAGVLADYVGSRQAVALIALVGLLLLPFVAGWSGLSLSTAQGMRQTRRKPQG